MAGIGNQYEMHLRVGSGVPTFVPSAIGQHYVDIFNKRVYQSIGDATVADWGKALATVQDIENLSLAVTKTTVGLGFVENFPVATTDDASIGTSNVTYMTPSRTSLLINTLFLPLLANHTADTTNPHGVDKVQVGLSNVQNYGIATQGEAEAGVSSTKYMTPLLVKAAIDALAAGALISHINNTLNPHAVTAAQLQAYTSAQVDTLFSNLSSTLYTSAEIDILLTSVTVDAYTRAETDVLLGNVTVDLETMGGYSGATIDALIQTIPRVIYPIVHVQGDITGAAETPRPVDCWDAIKTGSAAESVTKIYAIGISQMFPGNPLSGPNGGLTDQADLDLLGAAGVPAGPAYVLMEAGPTDTEWVVVANVPLGTTAKLHSRALLEGVNTRRIVPGQTLIYNAFEAQTSAIYTDWSLFADKEWEVVYMDGTSININTIKHHRTEIRLLSETNVGLQFTAIQETPYPIQVRVVKQAPAELSINTSNVIGRSSGDPIVVIRDFGVIEATRFGTDRWVIVGDTDIEYLEV